MRRLLTFTLGVFVLLLGWPALVAAAHPIDSTNIDQYSRLEVGPTSIRLRYIVEMGDLPAYLERRAIDTNVDAQLSGEEQERYLSKRIPELIAGLPLTVAGARLELRLVRKEISFPEVVVEDVQGALIMLRIVLDFEAQLPQVTQSTSFEYHNNNFADATGWRGY